MTRIYLSPPEVGDEERRMLLEAFDSNWIAPAGPDIDAFERELAERVGVGHAVALSSGTAALHLALMLVGVGPGDDVLVPSFTFVASAAAVVYIGANPVLIDCSPSTWTIDPDLVAAELARRATEREAPGCSGHRRPLRAVRRLRQARSRCATNTGSPWWPTPPRRWGRPTGGGRPDRSARPACSPSMATRSSPPAVAGCW